MGPYWDLSAPSVLCILLGPRELTRRSQRLVFENWVSNRIRSTWKHCLSFLGKHTGAKILYLSKYSHIENPKFCKIHLSEISFFTKFTILKSQFSQNSHFWNLIFSKIHTSEISIFTKFTFLKSLFSQNSQKVYIHGTLCIFYKKKSHTYLSSL